ncbi:MAG: hypothetical protein ACLGHY_14565, partial [Gammaproteobacteria bacterium]
SYADSLKLYKASRKALEDKLGKQGMMLLYTVPWPPQGIYSKRPLAAGADMKGLKWRAYSPATAKIAELVGAQPITVQAAEVPQADVRRALTLDGDLVRVSSLALSGGREALAAVRLRVGTPLSPMLAGTVADVGAALERTGPAAVEHKLDGARVLLDPVWSERCSPSQKVGPRRLHPVPVPLSAIGQVDAVVISHDRTFLDAVCAEVVDLDPNHLGLDGEGGTRFTGGYSAYLRAKRDS